MVKHEVTHLAKLDQLIERFKQFAVVSLQASTGKQNMINTSGKSMVPLSAESNKTYTGKSCSAIWYLWVLKNHETKTKPINLTCCRVIQKSLLVGVLTRTENWLLSSWWLCGAMVRWFQAAQWTYCPSEGPHHSACQLFRCNRTNLTGYLTRRASAVSILTL